MRALECPDPAGLRPRFAAHAYSSCCPFPPRWQVCSVEEQKVVVKLGEQAKEKGIECICWAGHADASNGGGRRVLSGRRDGVVQLWDIDAKCGPSNNAGRLPYHCPYHWIWFGPPGNAPRGDTQHLCAPVPRCELASFDPISGAHSAPRSIALLGDHDEGSARRFLTCCENGAVAVRVLDDTMRR